VCRPVTVRLTPLIANVTQISWGKALGVFDARLAGIPPEHGTKLRHWKEIVARVHSDFAAKLPAAELPTLATRERLKDDFTEGSRHQNMMLPGVDQ
jgi:hypothetical protein